MVLVWLWCGMRDVPTCRCDVCWMRYLWGLVFNGVDVLRMELLLLLGFMQRCLCTECLTLGLRCCLTVRFVILVVVMYFTFGFI